MSRTHTRTVAHLEVSAAAFEEVRAKLAAADYGHAFSIEGEPGHEEVVAIDMHGIALIPLPTGDILDEKIRRIVEEARGKPMRVRYAAFDRIVALFDASPMKPPAEQTRRCIIGDYCQIHGFIHGAESEELRAALEKLIAEAKDQRSSLSRGDVTDLLNRIDARDSLAYLDAKARGENGPAADQTAAPRDRIT